MSVQALPAGLTGLEILHEMLAGRLPAPSMAVTLGFTLAAAEEGRVTFSGAPGADALNPMGAVHGGWFGAIIDSALGCAVLSRLPPGRGYTTLEYKINLIRALSPGVVVDVVAEAGHVGRSTGVAEARMTGRDCGRLFAIGSTTCLLFDAP